MDTTYRFRFLIYLAAFMLFLSVCFVYAEPLPSPRQSPSHLLFQVAPQHARFLAPSADEPTFDPAALPAIAVPVVSPQVLQQLENATHRHHGFLHRASQTGVHPAPANVQSESSALGLTIPSASSALSGH
jgi:hypothetical protein